MAARWKIILILMVLCSWSHKFSQAQFLNSPNEIVTARTFLSKDQFHAGQSFEAVIRIEIQDGWHINANPAGQNYLIPTELILPEQPYLSLESVLYSEGEITELASVGKVPLYHYQSLIGFKGQVSNSAPLGLIEFMSVLRYQACNDQSCLMPTELSVPIQLKIVSSEKSTQSIHTDIFENFNFNPFSKDIREQNENLPPDDQFLSALSKGHLWAFLFVFIGGILTSLTPCVYPLVPITVSVFGAGKDTSRRKSFLLSISYVFGMAVMYSILGVIVASTGSVFGTIMANPIAMGLVCTILIILGLSMLGLFDLQLPMSIQNRLNAVGGSGFGGAFIMGTVAGVIAAPCTGPALGAVLSYVATTNNITLGFFLMLTYAIGMGLLFIVIGTFSSILGSLPKSGGWMYVLENIFGVAIIAMSLFYLKNIWLPLNLLLRNSVEFLAIGLIFIINGIQIGKFTKRFKDLRGLSYLQKAFGVLIAVIGFYIVAGGFINGGFQFKETLRSHNNEPKVNWIKDESEGFMIAKQKNKPIMIDFYADWCSACKELDHRTFSQPEVVERLNDFVTIKLDFTNPKDPRIKTLKAKYQVSGLPIVAFFDSSGQELEGKRISSFIPADKFLTWIGDIR
ncbi:MAG: protein-disulfide reductase DsbD [Candidatus Poribacteria bacterium]|nr:protein-disulfide reductase DsbD [Candidatus Poribacteria bacterium]